MISSQVSPQDEPMVQVSDPVLAAEAHRDDVVQNLPPSENRRFYPALDGLRAVAVLMVFFQHYFLKPDWLRWGWTGVDLFFVLSGFLITGILFDTRNARHRFRNFYVRRTLRIFPLYYGILLLALLLDPVFHWVSHPVWYLWPVYLGNYGRFLWLHDFQTIPLVLDHLVSGRQGLAPPMVFYLGHFWSLCIEEQFYLAWPLVVFLVRDRVRLRNICVAAFFVCMAARCLCVLFLPAGLLGAGFLERFTPLRVDALLLGGFVALCLRGPEADRVQKWAVPVMWMSTAAFAGLQLYYLVTTHALYRLQNWILWPSAIGYSLIDLFAAGLILRTIDPTTVFFRLLEHRLLRRLGQISYGFYVFHDILHQVYGEIVLHVFGYVPHSSIVVAAVAFCGTTVIAYLSFRFYEAPFLRLKDRFTV